MSETLPAIPERFQAAYHYIKQLEQYERYIGAFIFGSLARGEATEHSDLDVMAAADHQFIQFMFFHGNDKVERYLKTDPIAALFVMHVGMNDFLKFHYQIQQKWWVSSKRLLVDLSTWDESLVYLIERFVSTCELAAKYQFWSAIIDHILKPLGGRQPIAENNCDCVICREDLSVLLNM